MQTPGGGYGFQNFDNDGRTVEISADVAPRQHRRIEEKESIPFRLSHVVINSPQPEKTVEFYARHFGAGGSTPNVRVNPQVNARLHQSPY